MIAETFYILISKTPNVLLMQHVLGNLVYNRMMYLEYVFITLIKIVLL